MKHGIYLLVLICVVLISPILGAQGCSDAGVCTAGSLGPGAKRDTSKYRITLGYSFGIGEQAVGIQALMLQGDIQITKKTVLQMKVPFISAVGNLGANSGLGDIIASLSATVQSNSWRVSPFAGMRIATGKANAAPNVLGSALPLPMPYQTSLGTNDILAGIGFSKQKWKIGLGYQHPLNANSNGFDTAEWKMNADAKAYFSSRNLVRKPDLILRVEKLFRLSKWNVTPGLLGIYKVAEELRSVWVSGVSGFGLVDQKIAGSSGLTINGMLNASYSMNVKSSFAVNVATPFVVRQNRPDGLTRAFVFGLSYSHRL